MSGIPFSASRKFVMPSEAEASNRVHTGPLVALGRCLGFARHDDLGYTLRYFGSLLNRG
jgi:hypothetical protein